MLTLTVKIGKHRSDEAGVGAVRQLLADVCAGQGLGGPEPWRGWRPVRLLRRAKAGLGPGLRLPWSAACGWLRAASCWGSRAASGPRMSVQVSGWPRHDRW